jgi:hypothetical protein
MQQFNDNYMISAFKALSVDGICAKDSSKIAAAGGGK